MKAVAYQGSCKGGGKYNGGGGKLSSPLVYHVTMYIVIQQVTYKNHKGAMSQWPPSNLNVLLYERHILTLFKIKCPNILFYCVSVFSQSSFNVNELVNYYFCFLLM